MPHQANRLIVDQMVTEGWFRNPRREPSSSDNWWLVEDTQGRTALLYVVRFTPFSESGEPRRIPNTPALPRIAALHRNNKYTAGPFIALAEASDPGPDPDIVSIRVWRLFDQHLSGANRVRVEDLGKPALAC